MCLDDKNVRSGNKKLPYGPGITPPARRLGRRDLRQPVVDTNQTREGGADSGAVGFGVTAFHQVHHPMFAYLGESTRHFALDTEGPPQYPDDGSHSKKRTESSLQTRTTCQIVPTTSFDTFDGPSRCSRCESIAFRKKPGAESRRLIGRSFAINQILVRNTRSPRAVSTMLVNPGGHVPSLSACREHVVTNAHVFAVPT